jgi:hypothetical protein
MAPKPPKIKNGRPPPVDKLIIPAVVVALAILAYQFTVEKSAQRKVQALVADSSFRISSSVVFPAAFGEPFLVLTPLCTDRRLELTQFSFSFRLR